MPKPKAHAAAAGRDCVVFVRCTPKEAAQIAAAAKRSGLPTSSFVRSTVLESIRGTA